MWTKTRHIVTIWPIFCFQSEIGRKNNLDNQCYPHDSFTFSAFAIISHSLITEKSSLLKNNIRINDLT